MRPYRDVSRYLMSRLSAWSDTSTQILAFLDIEAGVDDSDGDEPEDHIDIGTICWAEHISKLTSELHQTLSQTRLK